MVLTGTARAVITKKGSSVLTAQPSSCFTTKRSFLAIGASVSKCAEFGSDAKKEISVLFQGRSLVEQRNCYILFLIAVPPPVLKYFHCPVRFSSYRNYISSHNGWISSGQADLFPPCCIARAAETGPHRPLRSLAFEITEMNGPSTVVRIDRIERFY